MDGLGAGLSVVVLVHDDLAAGTATTPNELSDVDGIRGVFLQGVPTRRDGGRQRRVGRDVIVRANVKNKAY